MKNSCEENKKLFVLWLIIVTCLGLSVWFWNIGSDTKAKTEKVKEATSLLEKATLVYSVDCENIISIGDSLMAKADSLLNLVK